MSAMSWTQQLDALQQKNLFRRCCVTDQRCQQFIEINQRQYINFCNNDYLGLSTHPLVKQAFVEAVDRFGFGSTASPQVSGYFSAHRALEQQFAEFMGRERALLFNSGYSANIGLMQALVKRQDHVFNDRLCHASILDGAQLSRAKQYRYRHNDVGHLAQLLAKHHHQRRCFIVAESVFSMEGDICHSRDLLSLARQYQATLILDDAHGIGVLGERGRGISELVKIDASELPCLVTPLGKAFAGMGALVSGSNELVEMVYQFSRSHRYSTALPPAVAAANVAALQQIIDEPWRVKQLQRSIQYCVDQAKLIGIKFVSNDLTPIKSLIIGNEKKALLIQQQLVEQGFYLSCIRPPTVPVGSARIRLSLNYLHQQQDIDHLLAALAQACEDFNVS